MPLSDKLKLTIWTAVHHIERTLAPTHPQHFKTIEDAKDHISKLCREADYDYHLRLNYNLRPNDPHQIVRLVKDRVHFLVAARAHDQGEFYLEEKLPDRKSLRDAVEADITRALLLIRIWPTEFLNADVAAKYVAGACALGEFDYTRFEGVAGDKFRIYVAWNTARRAWEERRCEIKVVPKEWVRQEKKENVKEQESEKGKLERGDVPKTMQGAIELDIHRITHSIPPSFWPPTFTNLNQARNFVGRYCCETGFRYTGWPDVSLHRYCLFVNFNAAKYALEDGVFKVEREVPERKAVRKTMGKEREGHMEQKDEVKVVEMRRPASMETENASGCDEAGVDGVKTMEWDNVRIGSQPWPDCSSSSSETAYLEDYFCSKAVAGSKEDAEAASIVLEEVAAVDPFKDLVAELERGYVLKAAFG